jgi:PAS domain S-box-containing protein
MASRAPTRSGLLEGDEVLAFLAQTSASVGVTLDYERALASAAGAAVPRFADWCGVDIVEPTGRVRQIVSADLSPEHERFLASLRDADCAGIAAPGPRVHIVAPLIARERTLGAITFLLTEPGRAYGERDVAVAGELARRLALAVDNARLYEAAERTSERLAFLADASASAGATLDYERVLSHAARAAVPRFADWCAVDIVEADGSLRQTSSPLDAAHEALMLELRRRYRAEHGSSEGVMRVIATGESELRTDVAGMSRIALEDDELEEYERLSPQSYMIVPLIARDRTLGAMTFMSTTPGRHYGRVDLQLATDLAHRLALAVDNARLFAEAEQGRERVGFLVEATELLSETLDVDGLLNRLAALTVPRLADWCRTYLVEPDGELRMVAVTHTDPELVALDEEMQRRYPVRAGSESGTAAVVRTGRSQLVPDIPDEAIVASAEDEEHLRMLRAHGVRSAVMVPLLGRTGPIGALSLATAESGRRLTEEDLRLAEELGRRAGIAIENARLHEAVSEAAERSQEWLTLLIDNVQDYAIFSFDPEGRVTTWNRGAERLTGYTADEIVGEHFSRFYLPEDVAQGHPARELQIAAAEGRYEEEGWRVRQDGSRYWASVLITALRASDGELRGFAKVTRDMTDRKIVEEELRRSNEELERYAYVASHDLSEPLRVIAGFSSLLRRRFGGRLGEDGDSFIEAILDGTERMQSLIDDLLTFSRLDRATHDLAPVATADVVAEAIRVLGETDGEVVVDGELPVVLGQRSLLGQLFQNLIGNGLKFAAGQRARVVVWAEPAEEGWCFAVRDNGIGIDPEDRERIFEIFERLHGRDEFTGTGIGLAICRKVVELHGGRIWVQDGPDGGSEFRFTLPAAEK